MRVTANPRANKTSLAEIANNFRELPEEAQSVALRRIDELINRQSDEKLKEYLENVKEMLDFPNNYPFHIPPTKVIGNLKITILPLKNNGYICFHDFEWRAFISSRKPKKRIGKSIRWALKRAKQPIILEGRND